MNREGWVIAVLPASPKCFSEAFLLTQAVRQFPWVVRHGYTVVFDLREGKSLKSRMRWANREKAEVAVILGPDELENGTVTIKTLYDGEQETVPRGELEARLWQVTP